LIDKDGSVEFYREKDIIGGGRRMSIRRERNDGERIVVPARRLSSFISEEIDMLKLDVEGAETSVLQDLAETVRLQMVRQMHLEYHHHIDDKEDKLSSMLGMLEDHGFGYQIGAQTGCWPKPGSFQISHCTATASSTVDKLESCRNHGSLPLTRCAQPSIATRGQDGDWL
jgi:hypothetical protein